MLFRIVFLILVLGFSQTLLGQEIEENEEEESELKNAIALSIGYTFIPGAAELEGTTSTGFLVPTLGLDYARYINERWMVAAIGELELGQYLVIDQDLPRERAWILMGAGFYRLPKEWKPFIGMGWEHDIHADLFVARIGIEKKYMIGKNYEWGIMAFWDLKRNYDTWSLMLILGKGW